MERLDDQTGRAVKDLTSLQRLTLQNGIFLSPGQRLSTGIWNFYSNPGATETRGRKKARYLRALSRVGQIKTQRANLLAACTNSRSIRQ